jgi:DNA/RNA endonuclease G (NUC1)
MSFREERNDLLPPEMCARLSDFYRSGYDRGHLAPAADHRQSVTHMRSTFDLANIAPQIGKGFNRSYWARLESFVRHLTSRFDGMLGAVCLCVCACLYMCMFVCACVFVFVRFYVQCVLVCA